MNIENQEVKIKKSFKELVLTEIEKVKNPSGFLRGIKSDIKNSLRKAYKSEFLKFYYKAQLEVIESLILQKEGLRG